MPGAYRRLCRSQWRKTPRGRMRGDKNASRTLDEFNFGTKIAAVHRPCFQTKSGQPLEKSAPRRCRDSSSSLKAKKFSQVPFPFGFSLLWLAHLFFIGIRFSLHAVLQFLPTCSTLLSLPHGYPSLQWLGDFSSSTIERQLQPAGPVSFIE